MQLVTKNGDWFASVNNVPLQSTIRHLSLLPTKDLMDCIELQVLFSLLERKTQIWTKQNKTAIIKGIAVAHPGFSTLDVQGVITYYLVNLSAKQYEC